MLALVFFIVGKDLDFLGAKVYGYGRSAKKDLGYLKGYYTKPFLHDFLKKLDYVINVMPSTKETEGLLNDGVLENCSGIVVSTFLIKYVYIYVSERRAVFINIGRGSIISETELIKAIDNKWLKGAILDVFQNEPLPKNNPLWKIPQIYITPHISGPTVAKEVVEVFQNNYKLYNEGKILSFVVEWDREY